MCLWATWSVPLSSLTLYVVHSGLKVYISLTCSLSLFLWATWFLIHVFTIEQPKCVLLSDLICTIEQVDFEIFSGLNMFIWATFTTCRLLTNEQSECVLLERSLYIWAVWLFTFERPDYEHLIGLTMGIWAAWLCAFEWPVYLWAAWSDVLLVVVCPWWLTSYSQTWTLLMSLSHSWLARQLMSHVTSGVPPPPPLNILILLINKIWLCSNTNIYKIWRSRFYLYL